MANSYSKNFSLQDLFNCKELKNVLPLVNYREKTTEDGKIQRRTRIKTVPFVVYETAKKSAKPFYSPFTPTKSGLHIELGGTLIGDYNTCYESVYKALVGVKYTLSFTANNIDMIRSAIKESAKEGQTPKLYLRANSIQEIKGMSKQKLYTLMDDIMQNIFYSNDYPKTKAKFKVSEIPIKSPFTYEQRKERWQNKVGDYE